MPSYDINPLTVSEVGRGFIRVESPDAKSVILGSSDHREDTWTIEHIVNKDSQPNILKTNSRLVLQHIKGLKISRKGMADNDMADNVQVGSSFAEQNGETPPGDSSSPRPPDANAPPPADGMKQGLQSATSSEPSTPVSHRHHRVEDTPALGGRFQAALQKDQLIDNQQNPSLNFSIPQLGPASPEASQGTPRQNGLTSATKDSAEDQDETHRGDETGASLSPSLPKGHRMNENIPPPNQASQSSQLAQDQNSQDVQEGPSKHHKVNGSSDSKSRDTAEEARYSTPGKAWEPGKIQTNHPGVVAVPQNPQTDLQQNDTANSEMIDQFEKETTDDNGKRLGTAQEHTSSRNSNEHTSPPDGEAHPESSKADGNGDVQSPEHTEEDSPNSPSSGGRAQFRKRKPEQEGPAGVDQMQTPLPKKPKKVSETATGGDESADEGNNSEDAVSSPPSPRTRGRPRKGAKASDLNNTEAAQIVREEHCGVDKPSASTTSTPAKKKRGRPKKRNGTDDQPVDATPKEPVDTSQSPKDKRKRKSTEVDSLHLSSGVTKKAKRVSIGSGAEPAYHGKAPRVMFTGSTVLDNHLIRDFFAKQNGTVVKESTSTYFDVLVVGGGELKRTIKLLLAIALGKPVVTDSWLVHSQKTGRLLPTQGYQPKAKLEVGLGVDLSNTADRTKLFEGKIFVVTPALKNVYGAMYHEAQELAKTVGAKRMVSKAARDVKVGPDIIVMAKDKRDADYIALEEEGIECFHKDLLTTSILKGTVDLGSEDVKISTKAGRTKDKGSRWSNTATTPKSSKAGTGPATTKKGRGRPRKSI